MKEYFAVFALATGAAFAITPLVIRVARRVKAVDRPAHRKSTSCRPVPSLGGWAIFLGMLVALAGSMAMGLGVFTGAAGDSAGGAAALGAGLAMLLLGTVDDRLGMSSSIKFLIQLLVASVIVSLGITFNRLDIPGYGPIDLGWMAVPLTLIWLVGVTNAVNLIDGIDGLATGVAMVVALAIMLIAGMGGQSAEVFLAAAVAGGCLGFLPYNFSPARIFLGDSGSLSLGMTLAVLAITSSTKSAVAGSMLVPVLLLGYPALDTLLVMSRRWLRGKSIFSGDRGHIHHHLLASGLNHRQSALILYAFCLLFCALAIGMASQYHMIALGGGSLTLAIAVALGGNQLGYRQHSSLRRLLGERPQFRAAQYRAKLAGQELAMAKNPDELLKVLTGISEHFGVRRLKVHLRDSPASTRRWWIALDPNMSDGPAPAGSTGLANARVRDKFRFPELKLTMRVELSASELPADLQMEHRVQLAFVLRIFARRLVELSRPNRPARAVVNGDHSLMRENTPPSDLRPVITIKQPPTRPRANGSYQPAIDSA